MHHGFLPACLAVLVAGCIGDGSDPADSTDTVGATSDATSDTSDNTTTPPGPIDVTVTDGAAPLDGTTVVFHDAEGAALASATTDGLGQASFDAFPTGGAVTVVVEGGAAGTVLLTSLELEPGDDVHLTPVASTASLASVDVDVVAFEGATEHWVTAGCGYELVTPGATSTYDLGPSCVNAEDEATFVAYASDSAGKGTVAFAVHEDVAIGGTGTPGVTFETWRQDFSQVAVTATKAPPTMTELEVYHFELQDGVVVHGGFGFGVEAPPGGGAAFRLDHVIGEFDATSIRLTMRHDTKDHRSSSVIFRAFDTPPATLDIDLSADLMPRLHSAELDFEDRRLHWSEDGPVTEADATSARLVWVRDETAFTWSISGPAASSAELTLPELPESIGSWWPTADSDFVGGPVVAHLGHTAVASYEEIRQTVPAPVFVAPTVAAPYTMWTTQTGP